MSKMSNIHLELTEQANELGFESLEEAEARGYTVKYSGNEAFLVPDIDKAYEERHREWEKQRNIIIGKLEMLINDTPYKVYEDTLSEAVKFIKEQCHD